MKTRSILLLALVILTGEAVGQRRTKAFISVPNLSDTVLTPSAVFSIQGKKKQDNPTWILLETPGGDSTFFSGHVENYKEIESDPLAYYSVGPYNFTLPKQDFRLGDKGIVYDALDRKQEAITLEIDPDVCADEIRVGFSRDSLSTYYGLPVRLVVDRPEIQWSFRENILVPTILDHIIDGAGKSEEEYLLMPILANGKACTLFWLERETVNGLVKEVVYEPSLRDSRAFSRSEGGQYMLVNREIIGFQVVVEAPVLVKKKPKGVKKQEHDKRAKAH